MKKRGQVTLFVIFGVILLIIIGLFLYLKTNIFMFNPSSEDLNSELQSINEHILDCVEVTGDQPIITLGLHGGYLEPPTNSYRLYSDYPVSYLCYNIPDRLQCMNRMLRKNDMESQISDTISKSVIDCIDIEGFRRFGSFNILTPSPLKVSTKIFSDSVLVNVNYPVTLKSTKSEAQAQQSDFSYSFIYPLGELYDLSQEIVNAEAVFGDFDQLVYMVSKMGRYRIEKKRPYPDKIYIMNLKDDNYIFQFAIQGEPS